MNPTLWLLVPVALCDECLDFCRLTIPICQSQCVQGVCVNLSWADAYSADILFDLTAPLPNPVACGMARTHLAVTPFLLSGTVALEGVFGDEVLFELVKDDDQILELTPRMFQIFMEHMAEERVTIGTMGEIDCTTARQMEEWPNIWVELEPRNVVFVLTCDHYLTMTRDICRFNVTQGKNGRILRISQAMLDRMSVAYFV